MIDDPWKTDLLISMLKESLPLEANCFGWEIPHEAAEGGFVGT
jgi:hypothetical protein